MSGVVLLGALVVGTIGLVAFVGRSIEAHPVSARARADRLVATGLSARAVIAGVEPTGVVDNRLSVQCDLHLRVEPLDDAEPFDAVHTVVVDRDRLPSVGDVLACWYSPDTGSTDRPADLVVAGPGRDDELAADAA